MSEQNSAWDGERVRKWLESRFAASQRDQDYADRKGRDYQDDYDKAAAETFVCRLTKGSDKTDDQPRFIAFLTEQLGKDEYRWSGVYDDRRFEREVRAYLRKLIKKAKVNEGFDKLSQFQ